VLGPITRRSEYDAHPVGKPPITYRNTDRAAARSNVQLVGGKTGYNDFARYCLTVATKIDGHTYYMAFLGDEGKLTRFGDVARVADWIVSHKAKTVLATASTPAATAPVPRAPAATAPPVAPMFEASPAAPMVEAPPAPPILSSPVPAAPAPAATATP
jgi:D-alanyl-D-alanine carboxypeptidase